MSFAGVLILAFIISCFDMDTTLISALNEIFGTHYSTNVFWLIAVAIGIIVSIAEIFSQRKR